MMAFLLLEVRKAMKFTVRFVHSRNVEKEILRFVDCASRYIRIMKTNLLHYLSSVYYVSQPLHVSGIFVAHYHEVNCIYTTIGRVQLKCDGTR